MRQRGTERARRGESKRGTKTQIAVSSCASHFALLAPYEGERNTPCQLTKMFTPTARPVEGGEDENTHQPNRSWIFCLMQRKHLISTGVYYDIMIIMKLTSETSSTSVELLNAHFHSFTNSLFH